MFYELNRERITKKIHHLSSENLNYPSHMHNCFEMIFVSNGNINLKIMNESYNLSMGELALISPNTPHSYQVNSKQIKNTIDMFFISITYIEEVTKIFDKQYLKNPYVYLTQNQCKNYLYPLIDNIEKNSNDFFVKGLTYILFDIIITNGNLAPKEGCISNDIAFKILRMVGQNYHKDISLKTIAESQNVCPTYVSRIFNKNLGIGFNNYVAHLRVEKSCGLLVTTDDNIIDIAIECGFDNQRSFNRTFKKIIGQSPGEYRKAQSK